MSATFNAADIIGKTLYAKTSVPLKRNPDDNAAVVYTVSPGGTVGIVNSYILSKPGRNANLYWQFSDGNNNFYAEHLIGRFDTKSVEVQGATSLEDQQEAAAAAAETWADKAGKYISYLAAGFGLFVLLRDQLKK
jgi:hypothetical protein